MSVRVIAACLGPGVVAGAAGALMMWHWPRARLVAPRIDQSTIRDDVRRHPALARFLRRRLDPDALTGLVLTAAVTVATIGALGAGFLLRQVQRGSGFAEWDQSIAEFGATHATDGSTWLLRKLTMLGGTELGLLLMGVVWVVEHRRHRSRAVPGFLLLTFAGQNAIANITKVIVDRERPDIARLTGFASASFPSGHSAQAAAMFAAFALLLGRGRSRATKALIVGAAAALAAVVASTRALLGVHWFTDVLAGVAVGWSWFALCSVAFGGWLLRFGAPVAQAESEAERVTSAPHP